MTTNASTPELRLYVINAGIGESIIVHMPNNKWGVVDCYAPSIIESNTNPTLQFLIKCQVKELEFLCLTHPHDDHYRGMSHLLNRFSTKYFWRSAAMTSEHLMMLLDYLKVDAQEREDDSDFESANDLQTTLCLVKEKRSQGLLVKHMSDIKTLYPIPVRLTKVESSDDVEIISIAPSGNNIEQYQDSLRRCFTGDGRLKPAMPRLRHNDISAALLIRYGHTHIVLGGDVEAPNWRDTLSALNNEDLAAQAVKVSHHGSTTGYTPNLWAVFSAKGKPFSIITPYRKHRLPKKEAVEHIKEHTDHLMTTCRSAIPFDTHANFDIWENYTPQVKFAIRNVFRSFSADRRDELGICSLAFDNRGNCVSISYDGAACPL